MHAHNSYIFYFDKTFGPVSWERTVKKDHVVIYSICLNAERPMLMHSVRDNTSLHAHNKCFISFQLCLYNCNHILSPCRTHSQWFPHYGRPASPPAQTTQQHNTTVKLRLSLLLLANVSQHSSLWSRMHTPTTDTTSNPLTRTAKLKTNN